MVIGRCDFHDIHTHNIHALETTQDLQHRIAGKTSRYGRPGARRKSGIKAIDIKGQVGLSASHPLPHAVTDRFTPQTMNFVGIQDEKLMFAGIVFGSDPNLYRSRRVNQAFARRPVKHRPVIKLSAVLIGIGMRIKMNQSKLTMHRVMRSQ